MKENKKFIIGGIAGAVVFLGLLAAFFVCSREFYAGRFSAHAMVSNTDVSGMTAEEALQSMNHSDGFSINLKKDGTSYAVDISQAVFREFDSGEVQECLSRISFLDYLFRREVVLSLKPDKVQVRDEKLQEILQKALPKATAYTADAYFDEELNLVEEVYGDDINYKNLLEKIRTDIAEGNELEYRLEDYCNQPQVKASDAAMASADETIRKYKNMSIVFTFGKEKETIDGAMICRHLSYKDGKLVLKKKWVSEFVRQMARTYNTYGKTRKFKTTKDGVVTIRGGILGWWINEDETTKKIKKLLDKQKSETTEPIYRNVAARHGKDDVGNTYVEVSLERQHLWYYKNGKKIMESKVVTGLPTKERQTVKGVHRIFGKQRDRWLGTIAVQGYRSHVNYWMPFNWDGQGLHDAPWRHGRFGGTIYKTGGSHGCVNMPPETAAKLYDYVSIGTPVVVY